MPNLRWNHQAVVRTFSRPQLTPLLRILNCCGQSKTTWKTLNFWGTRLYRLMKTTEMLGQGAEEFKFNYLKDQRLRNVGTLIQNLYIKSQVAFKIVCVQVNKKYRKKLKKRYLFQLTYIPVKLRKRFFYRLLAQIIQQSEARSFKHKYCTTVHECLENFSSSPLFTFKKSILAKLAKTTK